MTNEVFFECCANTIPDAPPRWPHALVANPLLDSALTSLPSIAMTPDQFRSLALCLPEAVESAHMGTPDFRVRGKIFATLGSANNGRCVVKFTLEQQEMFVHVEPAAFAPVEGGWGRKGWTWLHLQAATTVIVRDALDSAWRNIAPKRLAATFPPIVQPTC